MKKIFVYGILQKGISSDRFGMKDEHYIGRAILKGYKRRSLTAIFPSNDGTDEVEGDVWEVPDEIEEHLNSFESGFGYNRGITNPILKSTGEEFETISYLLPKEYNW